MKRARGQAFLLVASLCLVAALAPQARAGVGGTLEAAKQADFFKFFGLVEDGRRAEERGLAVVSFRPRSEKFRELVRLVVKVNADDSIREMELTLERSFVDDAANGVFARDIAKSFLRAAVPVADAPRVNDLANEIEFPGEMKGYKIMRARPDPKLPAQPTKGYQVYTGSLQLYEDSFAQSTLRVENLRAEKGAALLMRVAAKASAARRAGRRARGT
jgi:hypothetical protein